MPGVCVSPSWWPGPSSPLGLDLLMTISGRWQGVAAFGAVDALAAVAVCVTLTCQESWLRAGHWLGRCR